MGDRSAQLNLSPTGYGRDAVVVDGQNLSNAVRRVLLTAEVGEPPTLVLELAPRAFLVDAEGARVGVSPVGEHILTQLGWRAPGTGPDSECSALCRDVERDRDALAATVAAIGDAISPTGERPEEALGTLAGDVARVVEQRDQLVALVGEMLRHFTVRGSGGYPCRAAIRTGWISLETANGWRTQLHQVAYPSDPPPG